MIGKTIKVDWSTSIYDKGGFARICVELDLQKPLLPFFNVFGEERPIAHEGLHLVCFHCGKYGHCNEKCPSNQEEELGDDAGTTKSFEVRGDGMSKVKVEGETVPTELKPVTNSEKATRGSGRGPGMLVRRDFRARVNGAEITGLGGGVMPKNQQGYVTGNQSHNQRGFMNGEDMKKETRGVEFKKGHEGNKVGSMEAAKRNFGKEATNSKLEWAPVGSKRKNTSKPKVRGKGNKPSNHDKGRNKEQLGFGVQPIAIQNPFSALQDESAHLQIKEMATKDGGPVTNGRVEDEQVERAELRRTNSSALLRTGSNQNDDMEMQSEEVQAIKVDEASNRVMVVVEDVKVHQPNHISL